MDDLVISIFITIDDFLQAERIEEPKNVTVYNSEILTTAIVAAKFFGNNFVMAMSYMKKYLIPAMLSKSQFIRRIHRLKAYITRIFDYLLINKYFEVADIEDAKEVYIVDTFPVKICENARKERCRLTKGYDKKYLGYIASKKEYVYGLKVSVLTTLQGLPVDVIIADASEHDVKIFDKHEMTLFSRSKIYADKAYNSMALEAELFRNYDVELLPIRKNNYKGKIDEQAEALKYKRRKRIETTFSEIQFRFPKFLHCVKLDGLILKLFLAIVATALKLSGVTPI